MTIVTAGRSEVVIVVSPEAGPNEAQGAADLAKYVEMMSGVRPAVANAREAISGALKGKGAKLAWCWARRRIRRPAKTRF